jgi:hypothetical protein
VPGTDYRPRQAGDPENLVELHYEGAWHEAYIDARRRRDGVWEALVWYAVPRADGNRHGRKAWGTTTNCESRPLALASPWLGSDAEPHRGADDPDEVLNDAERGHKQPIRTAT